MGGVYFELAQCYKSKGDVHGALEQLQKALAVDSFPDKGAVYAGMGALYFDNSLYSDAARAFARSLLFAIGDSDSLAALVGNIKAQIMDGQEGVEKAANVLKKRFGARHEAMAEVAYHQGLRLLIEKKYDAAIKKFKYMAEAFEKSPRRADAAFQTGLCYYYMGKQAKALELFYDFLAQYPGSSFCAMAYFKIGMMLHERGDFMPAAGIFEKVVSASGGDEKTRFRAAYNAAIDFQKSSAWLEAARIYRMIIDSFPEEVSSSSTYLKMGFCCIQASHYEDALKYFQKAVAGAQPDEKPEIIYWTAYCWAKLGDHQKAVMEYLKVPALYPNAGQWAITSQFEAARLYEHSGEMKKAFALYKKIILADGEKGVFGKEAAVQCAHLNFLEKDN
jgi:tetratricopeptide (TPR) repeat protein